MSLNKNSKIVGSFNFFYYLCVIKINKMGISDLHRISKANLHKILNEEFPTDQFHKEESWVILLIKKFLK